MDALSIDMDELFSWAGTDLTRVTNIIYVHFTGYNSGGPDFDYPAVRLRDGAALGNPITIATKHPIYVEGDYNNVGWQPSAVMGDAITLLSRAWNDGNNEQSDPRQNAQSTEYYMAVLAGHSPTPCDHEDVGCPGGNYGGGLENYLRFLEHWNWTSPRPKAFYRGSLVSLYFAQQPPEANWACCVYYVPPDRDWAFETRFQDPNNLPPGTPVVGNVLQTAFRPIY